MVNSVRTTKRLTLLALVIVILASLSNNIVISERTTANCEKIELLKERSRMNIQRSLDEIDAGLRDPEFSVIYGPAADERKIVIRKSLQEFFDAFGPEQCKRFLWF